MIKIENVDVYGFEAAIRGMRNPLNSWDKSDSLWINKEGSCWDGMFFVGNNDLKLMKQLVNAGSDHSKFMRMITVTFDITAPMYWLKEAATYKVGTVRNSCSTMHTIHKKEFTLDDFSHDKLLFTATKSLESTIKELNEWRDIYLNGGQVQSDIYDTSVYVFNPKDKMVWWQMIQLLPSSYNQRSTVQLNYAVLRNIYHSRKAHKLDEWVDFCKWIESLPYSELITVEEQKELEEMAKNS